MKTRILVTLAVFTVTLHPGLALAQRAENRSFHDQMKDKRIAHRETQHAENKTFRQGLRNIPESERPAAILSHRAEQHGENTAFRDQQFGERKAFVQETLAKNPRLTDAQKQAILVHVDQQHSENVTFRDQQYQENTEKLQTILNDTSLNQKQKKEALKSFRESQKTENREHFAMQKSENKAFKDQIRSEVKAASQPAATATATA